MLSIEFIFAGIITGVLAGMLPGVGMAVTMITAYPILVHFEVHQIIQFYVTTILISQFIGSIVATYFAVPGEGSSIPAVIEGHSLAREGKASQAIFIAAYGSFIGGIVAAIFLYVLGVYLSNIFTIFTTTFNVLIISTVFLILFMTPAKNNYEKFGFPLIGIFLGSIGQAPHDEWELILTFGIEALEVGIPTMPLMLGLYTLPLLFFLHKQSQYKTSLVPFFDFKKIYFKFKHIVISIFYAIYGFLFGFIPGIGLPLVSNTSYKMQQYINTKFKLLSTRENNLMAAETANNSGAFSIMLPLLIFGIPTCTSQAVLYQILLDKSFVFSPIDFDYEIINVLLYIILFTCVMGFILACPMAKLLSLIFFRLENYIYLGLGLLITIITLYIGYQSLDFILYIFTIIISFGVGLLCKIKCYDALTIIYFYILTPFFLENWIRLAYIHEVWPLK